MSFFSFLNPFDNKNSSTEQSKRSIQNAQQQLRQTTPKYGALANSQTKQKYIKELDNTPKFHFLGAALQSANKGIQAEGVGAARSLTGTAQAFSGLYDLTTPGTGNNRFTKKLGDTGAGLDKYIKDKGLNQGAYKVGQVATDLLSFLAPSAAFELTSKAGGVGKALSSTEPLLNARGLKYATTPANLLNATVGTVRGQGAISAKGGDVSPGSVATSAATNLALGAGLNVLGEKIAGPLGNKLANVRTSSDLGQLKAKHDVEKSILQDMKQAESRAKGADKQALAKQTQAQQRKVNDIKSDMTTITQGGFISLPGGKKDLSKVDNVGEVKKQLKDVIPEDKIDGVAPAIAQTKDPNIIDNMLAKQRPPLPPAVATEITTPSVEGGVNLAGKGSLSTSGTTGASKSLVDATIPKAPKTGEVIPPKSDNAFDEILGAVKGTPATKGQAPVKGALAASREQAALLSKERGTRFAKGGQAKDVEGSAGYHSELAALKGDYSKVDYHPLINDIGPTRTEELFTGARKQILDTPDSVYQSMGLHPSGARLNTQRAVRKVLGLEPGIPTKSELRLLGVFSPKLAKEAEAAIPKHRQLFDLASKIFGSARSAKSTADLSMGGRQGLFVAARHPVEWAKANVESVKYAKSNKYYDEQMAKIHGDEWGQLIDKHNKSVLTGGSAHEEAYAGSDVLTGETAKKAGVGHLVAGSERAYTGGLTTLRKNILEKNLKAFGKTAEEAEAKLGDKGIEGLIEAVSTLTGRGGKKGGWVEKHATTLQEALFSPRLWASRLQPFNPKFWARIGPAGRREAFQSLASFAAVAGTVLEAAHLAGADVEKDPRSSDFLKVKVGDTRYDILGGFQQNLVFGARQLTGSTKSSQSGRVTKYGQGYGSPTRLSAAFDAVRNKANPIVSAGANIIEGKDKAGNQINPLTEIGQLFVPISIQGSYHAIQRDGLKGLAGNAPDLIGISTQTYGKRDIKLSDSQQKYVDSLSNGQQKDASTSFFQTLKTTPSRDAAGEAMKKALGANPSETTIQKAVALAKAYNDKYTATFKDWSKQYPQYRKDEELIKKFNSGLITDSTLDRYIADIRKAGL